MNPRKILTAVFPTPRRPVTVRTAVPLMVFLALFLGGAAALEWTGTMLFARPWALLLVAVTPWLWWMHLGGSSGLVGARATTALLVRLFLAGVFVLLMAEPRAVRKSRSLSVVYALDVSDSVGEKRYNAILDDFVKRTRAGKEARDRAGLVVFGRNAAVEAPPSASFEYDELELNARIDKDGSNLEKGLSLAAAMLPDDTPGRIVLISDGAATEGSLTRVLDDLKSRRIPVDVAAVGYAFDEEVWLEKMELPRTVKIGETYEAAIVLSSLQAGRGKLVLRENDRVVYEKDIVYKAGKQRITLPIYLRAAGYYEYVARIVPAPKANGDPRDHRDENNVAVGSLFLKGKGKVLLVTDPEGEALDWRDLKDALAAAGREVEIQDAFRFPREALSLLPYDCIIFPNVPADAFDAIQLEALRDAVANQGSGFLMVGGRNSYGPGGYHRTPVEEILPVTMDISQRKVLPKAALVIILHTCEFPEGNTWGKRITKEAIKVLGAKDEVGVLVFDWSGVGNQGERWLFKLTPAGEYNKLVPLINQAQIGDMPSFQSTMKMGFDALKASDASAKHMIIISDGDPSPPPPELLKKFSAPAVRISVSTVAVFPHQMGDGGAFVDVLEGIAKETRGRFYFPQDPSILPRIFIKEAKTLRRSMIQEKTFTPKVAMYSHVLDGISALPPLEGYVLTTPKPRAETVLEGPDEKEPDPVLAIWRYELGRTAAFTSDLSSRWGKHWLGGRDYRPFVKQLVIDISRANKKSYLRMNAYAAGSTGVVTVEDYRADDAYVVLAAVVQGPHERRREIVMKQVGPKRYQGEIPLWGKGRYQVVVRGERDVPGETIEEKKKRGRETAVGGFVVPYSPEYLRFRSDPIALRTIAQRTGGRELVGTVESKDIFPPDREPRSSSRPVADLFLLALAILIPLDVGVRRVQPDLYVIKRWLGLAKKRSSTATLGALLKRKESIRFAPKEDEGFVPPAGGAKPAPKPDAGRAPGKARPAEAPKPKPEEKVDESSLSTTQRLLRKKKRWQGE